MKFTERLKTAEENGLGDYAAAFSGIASLAAVEPGQIDDRLNLYIPLSAVNSSDLRTAYVNASYMAFVFHAVNLMDDSDPTMRLTCVAGIMDATRDDWAPMLEVMTLGHRLSLAALLVKRLALRSHVSGAECAYILGLIDNAYVDRIRSKSHDMVKDLLSRSFGARADTGDEMTDDNAPLGDLLSDYDADLYKAVETITDRYLTIFESVDHEKRLSAFGQLRGVGSGVTGGTSRNAGAWKDRVDREVLLRTKLRTESSEMIGRYGGGTGGTPKLVYRVDMKQRRLFKLHRVKSENVLSDFFSCRTAWHAFLERAGVADDPARKRRFVQRLKCIMRPWTLAYSAFVVQTDDAEGPILLTPGEYMERYGEQVVSLQQHVPELICQAYAFSRRMPFYLSRLGPARLAEQLRTSPCVFYEKTDINRAYPDSMQLPWNIDATLLKDVLPEIEPGHCTAARIFAPLSSVKTPIYVVPLPRTDTDESTLPVAVMLMEYGARRHFGVAWQSGIKRTNYYPSWIKLGATETESARRAQQGADAWASLADTAFVCTRQIEG